MSVTIPTKQVITETFKSLLQNRQLLWWLGHVIVALNGLFYFSSVLSLDSNRTYYRRAYLGTLLSHAIVIYNSFGVKYTSLDSSILCDENVHYFAIALYWYLNKPIAVTLIPFYVYSVFHALTYFRSNIVQHIPIDREFVDEKINYFTNTYYTTAMNYMAYVEVVLILGRIILGVLIFNTSAVALVVFIHFLRLRYYLSDCMKEAVQNTTFQLDKWLLLPSSVKQDIVTKTTKPRFKAAAIYCTIKRVIIKYL